ncbi:MAG: hypothetical protein QNK04_10225 [Myxococcota bacterium]|nr:hypothetical protein [Myxococcota bacterium]
MLGWLILGAAAIYALARFFAGYPRPARPLGVLAPREAAFLDAAAEATFPPGGAIAISGCEAEVAAYTDRWLQVLHPRIRTLMRLLFFMVENATFFFWAPGPRGWRRFSSLEPEQQRAALEGWSESRIFARRLVFVSLRAVLTMGYFAHPGVLRQLDLAPRAVDTPVCEADLLYPPIGKRTEDIRYGLSDLTPPSDGQPLGPETPLHPHFAETAS